MSFYQLIENCFPVDRDKVAIALPERGENSRWTYGELAASVDRAAGLFGELALQKGDRVAVQTEKSPEAFAIYLACLRSGLVFLPLNTAYQKEEVDYILSDAAPALYVGDPAREPMAGGNASFRTLTLDAEGRGSFSEAALRAPSAPTVPCDDKDLAALVYTSGTTGRPKGAMISHGALASNSLALRDAWRFTADDVLLHALPIFHIHGLFVACGCALLAGASMIWLSKFTVGGVLAQLPRASVFMGVPTYYVRLLESQDFTAAATKHMRLFTSGSAPLLSETHETFRDRTGHSIIERYGMTETGINTTNPYDGERRPGAVGLPLPGVEIRVTDEEDRELSGGEIGGLQVRGPNVFSGYWRRPELSKTEFAEGGWFRTGDVARIEADGYVHLVGRSKDMIISGGFNVYPKEIETLLDEQPGVNESAVIGVPHPDFGEAAVAIVVPSDSAELDAEALLTQLRSRLANYKMPKRAFVVDDLPRNVMGKVQKNLLRDRYRDLFSRPASPASDAA